MKRVFIIHCMQGTPSDFWYPWLKKELERRGFEVHVPEMPDTDYPKIEPWVATLKNNVGGIDDETYFVGHSIGCQTILRFLESFPSESRIGGSVFVAGWSSLQNLTDEEKEITQSWLSEPFDTNKVKQILNKSVAIFSDDDPYVSLDNSQVFKEKIGSKIIVEQNKGHYDTDSSVELPNVLEELINISK